MIRVRRAAARGYDRPMAEPFVGREAELAALADLTPTPTRSPTRCWAAFPPPPPAQQAIVEPNLRGAQPTAA